ncbi:MAG: hypothetical protein ACI9Y1_002782 [Lentisphaeria bacterium]|jgi:hypothetical protein
MKSLVIFAGGLTLLISWMTRTFLFQRWNRRLADIRSAQSDYFTFQSNNALFTAITKTADCDLWDELWELQNNNYDLGFSHLRTALSVSCSGKIDQNANRLARKYPFLGMGEHGLKAALVVVVQEELLKEKQEIEQYEGRSEKLFWFLYLCSSIIILFGNSLPE